VPKAEKPPKVSAKEKEKVAEAKPELEMPVRNYTPLIIAGAIGGGGVLVLGLLVTLVCLLVFGRREKQIAQNNTAKATAAAVAATQPNAEAATAEKTSETNPAGPVPQATAADPKAAESSAPPAGSSSVKESPPEPTATGTAASAPTEAKKEPTPEAKSESKPEVKPEEPKPAAKPAAPKAAPKPEPKPDPFKGLAKAVELPDLPEAPGQPATDTLMPAVLGPCKLDDKAPLSVTLLGGDAAIRSARQKFELQPKAGSPQGWDFALTGGPAPVNIATLSAKEGSLIFQWTEEGVKQATVAKQLSNCALNLVAGSAKQAVALRTVVLGAPLPIEIDKSGASVKWSLGDLPVAKHVFVEVTRVEGIKANKPEPKTANLGEPITVWLGATDKSYPLALKLTTSANARGVEVKLQPQVKLEGQEARLYRRKELLNLQPQIENELPFLAEKLEQAKRDRPSTDPLKGPLEKKQIDDRKAALTVQLAQRTTMRDQINYLIGFNDTYQGSAIHFRVSYQAGDTKIDLLRTEEEPPPGKAK
jgi:hypothetical protein